MICCSSSFDFLVECFDVGLLTSKFLSNVSVISLMPLVALHILQIAVDFPDLDWAFTKCVVMAYGK